MAAAEQHTGPGHGAGGGVAPVYERLPFILASSLTSSAATDTFAASDLNNYSGYDFEVWEVAGDIAGNYTHRDWSIKITDGSRNFAWMRAFIRCSVIFHAESNLSANRPAGNTWRLARPVIMRQGSTLTVDTQNNASGTPSLTMDIGFKGFLLVPLPEGDYRNEMIARSLRALP